MAELDGRVAELGRRRGELEAARADLGARQAAAESELAATEQRSAAIDRRLYGGEVSASKDLQAMTAEIAHLKERASHLEDSVLEVLEAAEPVEAELAAVVGELDALAARRAEVAARLAEAASAIEVELAELGTGRDKAAALVPGPLLATYERLRTRLGGVGVARLVGNHCDGCHLTLSAVELDMVRHLAEDEVYTCEQCSRILVP
jgi:predicted  nucleic acid-binding Zn-ribbon protein